MQRAETRSQLVLCAASSNDRWRRVVAVVSGGGDDGAPIREYGPLRLVHARKLPKFLPLPNITYHIIYPPHLRVLHFTP